MRITFQSKSGDADGFRSHLERQVAAELDTQEVSWRYEVQVRLPDGRFARYLPDFTIDEARDELQLPLWVECKPQTMLYDLRDTLGVTRRAGERFEQDVPVDGADAAALHAHGFEELAKPKRLAEVTGESVLVVGGVGGSSKLAIYFNATDIVFTRHQPFVNWPGHVREVEREQQRQQWAQQRAEWERQQRALEQSRLEAQRQRQDEHRQAVVRIVESLKPYTPKFPSQCFGCSAYGDSGGIYRIQQHQTDRWVRICTSCQVGAWSS